MDSAQSSIPFIELARTSERVAATSSRLEKKRLMADLLASVSPSEIASVVGWLAEEPVGGATGVGPAQLWALAQTPAPLDASVTLRDVDDAVNRARDGGHEIAADAMKALFAKLTEPERRLLTGSLTGSLRQGSAAGVMLLAIADRAKLAESDVRRAVMVKGSIARAADAILGAARESSIPRGIELFHALAPMLASSPPSLEAALALTTAPRIEWKVDGVRAQAHKRGQHVSIYSRQGNDITAGCASVLLPIANSASDSAVFDGEVVLEGEDGRARPFQDSFSAVAAATVPNGGDRLRIYLFDCLHRGGVDLLDEPLSARLTVLREITPRELWMPGIEGADAGEAARFYEDARERGHEGVMVKDLASTYRSGARGKAWQKVKEAETIDLVVLAVEPGSGRRKGTLSNLHLGARREDGTFCMVGKTFKGLTDAMLQWQTERLGSLATDRAGYVIYVRPELVVEIRYNDVQRSPRYPGGIALRFARVVRYREDKSPADVEPLAALVAKLPRMTPTAAPSPAQLSLFGEGVGARPTRSVHDKVK